MVGLIKKVDASTGFTKHVWNYPAQTQAALYWNRKRQRRRWALNRVNEAVEALKLETSGIFVFFCEDHFLMSTGHYGAALVVDSDPVYSPLDSDTESGLFVDFTESFFLADTGHYGAAYSVESDD